MNNEVNLILTKLKIVSEEKENGMYLCDKKHSKLLLDYITNLQEKYDKALELLNEYGMPCERDNFNLLDTDYCELNCSNDEEQFKKCWNEFIEWRLKNEK